MALISLVRVWPRQVEVELVGVDLGGELAATGKVFQIEELIFFEAVHGFHIALISVRGGLDARMLTITERFGEVALELAAIVGLPNQITQRDALAIQLLLDAGSENAAGRRAASFSEGP